VEAEQCTMPITKSILIVDDDNVILDVLTQAFRLQGYTVYTAKNGLDGLSTFKKEHADIVLTDIRMPGLSGDELATRIRRDSPRTKLAVMTGGDGEIGSKLFKDGTADHFFLKPFTLSHVCRTLTTEIQTC
jgi:DNA-binding response OmpR family regulator